MKVSFAAVIACAAALLFVAATPAATLRASGTGTATAPILSNIRLADGNLLADFTQTGTISGTFDGTFETTGNVIVYADGRTVVHAFVVFTGTTACGSGSVTFVGMDSMSAGVGSGRVTTVDAATDTAGIHADADLVLAGPTFTYDGTYSCLR
jgi:hypothetical protein